MNDALEWFIVIAIQSRLCCDSRYWSAGTGGIVLCNYYVLLFLTCNFILLSVLFLCLIGHVLLISLSAGKNIYSEVLLVQGCSPRGVLSNRDVGNCMFTLRNKVDPVSSHA